MARPFIDIDRFEEIIAALPHVNPDRDEFPWDEEGPPQGCPKCGNECQSLHEVGMCWSCHAFLCATCFFDLADTTNVADMSNCRACGTQLGVMCAPLVAKHEAASYALKTMGIEEPDDLMMIPQVIALEVDQRFKQIEELQVPEVREENEEGVRVGRGVQRQLSDKDRQTKIDLYGLILVGLNFVRLTVPLMFQGNYVLNWFRAYAFRAKLEGDGDAYDQIMQAVPEAFDIDRTYTCVASLPPFEAEEGVELQVAHQDLFETLFLEDKDVAQLNPDLEVVSEQEDTTGDPDFEALNGTKWKMRVWGVNSPTGGHECKVHRVIDIRWLFPTDHHAQLYHSLRLLENSEGQNTMTMDAPLVGESCHVFGGTTTFSFAEHELSLTVYLYLFRVENVLCKVFVSKGVRSLEDLDLQEVHRLGQAVMEKFNKPGPSH